MKHFTIFAAEETRNMLGIKSNRDSIKGVFADRLREQIALARKEPKQDNSQVQTKPSDGSKK